MSLFRPARRAETRSVSFQDVWGTGGDINDVVHGDRIATALRLIPVYSATSLIANLVSTAPMEAYREVSPGVLSRLPRQPQLIINPMPFRGTRIDWMHQGLASVLLTGNAIGYIVDIDNAGTPTKIIWFNPHDVQVIEEQVDWYHTPQYYWRGRPLDPTLVVHVPGYLMPGTVMGMSPLGLFKKQIETGLSAQDFQLDWYTNGAAPSGWFKNTAQTLPEGAAAKIKERFKASVKNRDLLVTGSDWEWTALSVPADEARFLESIKANATQIAAIYHVSPDDVGGETPHPMTYKTLEQDGIKTNVRALNPWAQRFQSVLSDLLPGSQKVNINLDGLAQGTIIERVQAHAVALATGQESHDEARASWGRAPMTPEEIQSWQDNYRGTQPDSSLSAHTGGDGKP